MKLLDRYQIEAAFDALNHRMSILELKAQIYIVGGAVMCLIHNARPSTKDVDAWFTESSSIREATRQVAEELNLPIDWLNDAAKAFIPQRAGFELWKSLSHLEILVADLRTLFAMKCAAARTQEDADDIRFLSDVMKLKCADEALSIVLEYYPETLLPVRARLLLEELFDDGP